MSHSENNKKWYIIEGNIGSGKTTLINILKNFNNFEVIEEPVNLWLNLKGDDNKNILQEFYEDPERYAYIFQTMVFKTRLNSIDHLQDKDIRFSERSIWTDKYVFGISCIESKKMNKLEAECYNYWFDWLEEKFNPQPDGIIYIKTTPQKCLERIEKRGRSEEATIPLAYLEELDSRHNKWLENWTKTPVLIINNDLDDNWQDVINQVTNFIKNDNITIDITNLNLTT
jgi:deoxyadenosine/deoxycytidine kinase